MFAAHNMLLTGTPASGVIFKAVNTSETSTVTIPAHNVGDIIVIVACRAKTQSASKPSAGGTVPTWTDIGTPGTGLRMAYAVATATNHTSGTWTNAWVMFAVVLSGQKATPIGGNAYASGATSSPAITLADSSGKSQILHFCYLYEGTGGAWTGNPSAGYTVRASGYSTVVDYAYRLITKDVTTTDGAASFGTTAIGGNGPTSAVEIVAA